MLRVGHGGGRLLPRSRDVAWCLSLSRSAAHTALLEVLQETLLRGPGQASPVVRAAAAAGTGEAALGANARVRK